jgi:predicted alpha-1,2-mannosidase
MKTLIRFILATILYGCSLTALWSQQAGSWGQYVDPRIGSEGLGRVFIGPSAPFGMVKPGPDCGCKANSGWLPMPEAVTGFSQVHVSGTGGGPKYGNILIQPFSGELSGTSHEAHREYEKMELGYYETTFQENGIKVEMTTSERASFYRFHYPASSNRALMIDAGFFLGENKIPDAREAQQFVGSEIEIISDTEIRGYSRIRGGWNNGKAYTVYFYAVADRPFEKTRTWKGDTMSETLKSQFDEGKKTGALVAFGQDSQPTAIQFKVGISFLSSLKAQANVQQDIPHWHFQGQLSALRAKWETLLGRIALQGNASSAQKRMFYTGIYHTLLMPVDRSGENPLWTDPVPYYDDFYAIWDTYRTSSPLITLLDPQRQAAIVNSLINIYKRDGYMPDARSGNGNGRTQGGSNAEAVIADAYVKGLNGIDYPLALQAMLKDATVPPGGNEEQEGRGGLIEYNRLGYVPYGIDRAGNRTVEYAYNDYNIATVAKGLGEKEIYEEYIRKADNWKNLWRDNCRQDGVSGFIMPRSADGAWLDSLPFGKSKVQHPTFVYNPDTRESPWYVAWWSAFFYEGISWEYSLSIPHDIPGLIEKCGGNEVFRKRLDLFFDKGYYNVNNEPSFLTPCLYHWVGRPDLSSSRIREIVKKNYSDLPAGLPGNDDSGAMSSWLAFHILGLYPNAGQSYYLINSPMVSEYTIDISQGKKFKVQAQDLSETNCVIQSATLNGEKLDRAWLEHAELMRGGILILKMGKKPSAWGMRMLPPSGLENKL